METVQVSVSDCMTEETVVAVAPEELLISASSTSNLPTGTVFADEDGQVRRCSIRNRKLW